MCGIAGIAHFDGRPVEEPVLRQVLSELHHRGPDGSGVFCRAGVGLGHTRLAIIDAAGGAQPMVSNDQNLALTYNGEVYNYHELRDELGGRPAFGTDSDTEVVLRAYERWGIAAIDRFRGMFAFALYDHRQQRLHLVRDRAGVKPLYYAHARGRLVFCSELWPLVQAGLVQREIDPEALAAYLHAGYVPAPQTIYRGMRKLEPGFRLEIDVTSGRIWRHRYWDVEPEPLDGSEDAAVDELNGLLDETVRLYMRADVPSGAFLSGGIDSTLITGLMTRQDAQPPRTFSIGFDDHRYSELDFAAEAASVLQARHTGRTIPAVAALEQFGRLSRHFGEPFADSSALPTWHVSRLAAQDVKVVLSGDGGDELFGGYNSYRHLAEFHNCLAGHLPRSLWQTLAWLGPTARLRRGAGNRSLTPWQVHCSRRRMFPSNEAGALLKEPVAAPDFERPDLSRPHDAIAACQWHDFKTYLVDDVLTKVDRMSMAHSIEVRVPLLDHKLIEFAFRLPLSLRLRAERQRGVVTKYLLRRSAERFVPRSFLDRPKQGFGIPLAEWCRTAWWPEIERVLTNRRDPLFDWLRFDRVAPLVRQFAAGDNMLTPRIWSLFALHLWLQNVHLATLPAAGSQAFRQAS